MGARKDPSRSFAYAFYRLKHAFPGGFRVALGARNQREQPGPRLAGSYCSERTQKAPCPRGTSTVTSPNPGIETLAPSYAVSGA